MLKTTFGLFLAAAIVVAAQTDRASIVVQAGHTARVNAIAADTNRDLVATASNDYTVRLWKVTPPGSGTLLRAFTSHTGFVTDVAFNINDEHQMASCSRDMTLRLWNVLSGASQRIDVSDRPSCLAYRPNSNILAVGSDEAPQVSFFDANNGSSTDRPIKTSAPVSRIAYTADGTYILCGLVNGKVEVRDARTKDLVRTVNVSKVPIVFVSYRGRNVVALAKDGIMVIAPEAGETTTGKLSGYVLHASITPSKDTLDVVTDAPAIVRVPLATLDVQTLAVDAKQIDVAITTKRGDLLAYGEVKSQQYSWLLQQHGQTAFNAIRTYSTIQTNLAFSHDGSLLAVGDNGGDVTVWDLKRPRDPMRFTGLGCAGVRSLTFAPGDSTLVVGGFGGTWLIALDLTTMTASNSLRGERDAAMIATINTTSAWVLDARAHELVSASTTGSTRSLVLKNARIGALSEDGTRIVVLTGGEGLDAGTADSVVIVDAGSREVVSRKPVKVALVTSITAPGNGSDVLCGTANGSVLSIATATGKVSAERKALHNGPVTSIAITADAMVTSGNDASIRFWNKESGSASYTQELKVHAGQVRSIAISDDGTMLASASNDGTVCLSRMQPNGDRAQHVFTLVSLEQDWAVFSNDGHFDASESAMRLLKVVHELDAFPIGSLRDSLYTPHILCGGATEGPKSVVLERVVSPPTIQITDPAMSVGTDTSHANVTFRFSVLRNGVSKIRVHNNDKLVSLTSKQIVNEDTFTESVPLSLVKGANQIRVVVRDVEGLESEDTVSIVYTPKVPPRPKMYILAIGINEYKNPDYALSYARSDAEAMVGALQKSVPSGTDVEVVQIFDDDADIDAVEDALTEIEEKAKPDDAFIFYYAGHGAVLKGAGENAYCFALHDVTNINDAENLRKESLLADSLRSHLLRIKALRQSVIIDACYSGMMMQTFSETDNARYVSGMQRATGATVLASVLPDKKSKEVDAFKHGLFTYAIVKGLEGAARDMDGEVTLFSLLNYITKALPSLCKQTGFAYQQPVLRYEGAAQSFVLSTK